jgi:TolB-like protein
MRTSRRGCALLAAAALLFPSACISQELSRLNLSMKPFEAVGQAEPEFAKTLSRQLMQAIERRSDFRVVYGGPTRYYLKGQVLADDKRSLVTLQLFESQSNRSLWLENYDYRSVTADEMADDIVAELLEALGPEAWP